MPVEAPGLPVLARPRGSADDPPAMSSIAALPPDPAFVASLPGCDFADAYAVTLARAGIDARDIATNAFDRALPGWAAGLMGLRNAVVARLGLKTAAVRRGFPVLRGSAAETVLGLDDRHLDFRVLIHVDPAGPDASRLTLTTAVRTHNRLGRAYLAVILPFHRLIIKSMLRRLQREFA